MIDKMWIGEIMTKSMIIQKQYFLREMYRRKDMAQ